MKQEKSRLTWFVTVFFIAILIILPISLQKWISAKDRIILTHPHRTKYEFVDELKFSPDGNFLAAKVYYSSIYEQRVGLWHIEKKTFQELQEYRGGSYYIGGI